MQTLQKKTTALQNKLTAASSSPKVSTPVISLATTSQSKEKENITPPVPQIPRHLQQAALPTPTAVRPASATLPLKKLSRPPSMERPLATMSHSALPDVFSEVRSTPENVSKGKKRCLPEDFDINPPAAAVLPDGSPAEGASTPRRRKQSQGQSIRNGFTPVRSNGGLRPTLGQPSPIRKTTAILSNLSDNLSNTPRRMFAHSKTLSNASGGSGGAVAPSRGWLGKLRGGSANTPRSNS